MKNIRGVSFKAALLGAVLATAAFVQTDSAIGASSVTVPPAVAAALTDSQRPDADKARDAGRKPGETLALAGVKPGDKVIDFLPGGGYYTRILAKAVGDNGKVYAVTPAELLKAMPKMGEGIQKVAGEYKNVVNLSVPVNETKAPEPVDVVFTALNYHDLHTPTFGPANIDQFNKSIFATLKSGGRFIVIDHAAEKGSGTRDSQKLHRIDVEAVKAQVKAAGFVLEQESDLLANPADPRTAGPFGPDMRGKTDQFYLKFRKP